MLFDIDMNFVAWIVVYVLQLNLFLFCLIKYLLMWLKGSEWKEKTENLQLELQQCYKAQSRLSEQLVVEVAESRASKALIQEKESAIVDMQKELTELRLFDVSYVL